MLFDVVVGNVFHAFAPFFFEDFVQVLQIFFPFFELVLDAVKDLFKFLDFLFWAFKNFSKCVFVHDAFEVTALLRFVGIFDLLHALFQAFPVFSCAWALDSWSFVLLLSCRCVLLCFRVLLLSVGLSVHDNSSAQCWRWHRLCSQLP